MTFLNKTDFTILFPGIHQDKEYNEWLLHFGATTILAKARAVLPLTGFASLMQMSDNEKTSLCNYNIDFQDPLKGPWGPQGLATTF